MLEPPEGHPLALQARISCLGQGEADMVIRAGSFSPWHRFSQAPTSCSRILAQATAGIWRRWSKQRGRPIPVCCTARCRPLPPQAKSPTCLPTMDSSPRARESWEPSRVFAMGLSLSPPLSSYGTALLSVRALGAALFARERDGPGRRFEIPLWHGGLAMQASHLLDVERNDLFLMHRRTPRMGARSTASINVRMVAGCISAFLRPASGPASRSPAAGPRNGCPIPVTRRCRISALPPNVTHLAK